MKTHHPLRITEIIAEVNHWARGADLAGEFDIGDLAHQAVALLEQARDRYENGND